MRLAGATGGKRHSGHTAAADAVALPAGRVRGTKASRNGRGTSLRRAVRAAARTIREPTRTEVPPMPAGSSPKRERQYEHIKESYQERGVSTDEAEERAARTVNKERREHGETKAQKKR
jgi:hypothetical protein